MDVEQVFLPQASRLQYSSQMELSVCLNRETVSLVAYPKLRRPSCRKNLILSLATV
jgi:hypothetical protein